MNLEEIRVKEFFLLKPGNFRAVESKTTLKNVYNSRPLCDDSECKRMQNLKFWSYRFFRTSIPV